MAWNLRRTWGPTSATTNPTLSFTTDPAAAGTTLIAVGGARTATGATAPPELVASDSHSGQWEKIAQSPTGESTQVAIFLRRNAVGVRSVTLSAVDNAAGSGYQLHVFEFEGEVPGDVVADVVLGENLTIWPPVEVAATPGALILGAHTVGVTNRLIGLTDASATTYSAPTFLASSGQQVRTAMKVATGSESTGPQWEVKPGGSSTSATSARIVTVAIAPGVGPAPLAVNVGTDRTVNVGEPVTVTATTTGGTGSRAYAWSTNNSNGTFADLDDATTTFTATTPGTYVLTCSVTDDTTTVTDSLTLTVLREVAFQPLVGATAPGWAVTGAANPAAALSDSDDASYVTSPENPSEAPIEGTAPPLMPPDQPLVVRCRPRRQAGTTGWAVARLYTGQTLRATSSVVPLPVDTFEVVDFTFPLADLTGITADDWQTGVRVVVAVTAT